MRPEAIETGRSAVSRFAYAAPTSVEEAVRVLSAAKGVAKLLSGGTDLLVQLRSGRLRADLLVDTKKIPGICGITVRPDGGFTIGAATPGIMLGEDAALAAAWPGVVEAAGLIGSVQVQGRATLAGNLCNASPAADSVPALIAAGATAVVMGPRGRREVAVLDVVLGPGQTSLARDEFVFTFRLPAPRPRSGDAYLRLTPRTEMDIAVVGCGIWLQLAADGTIAAARVALGAVAPTPLLVAEAAGVLVGRGLDEATLAALDAAARAACRPIDDMRGTIAYRTRIAGVLARRAATIAYQRAESRQ
jgi:carbon-monoxide dehydrogenase medium subunit